MPTRTNKSLKSSRNIYQRLNGETTCNNSFSNSASFENDEENIRTSSSHNGVLFDNISITGSFSFDNGESNWVRDNRYPFESKESIAAVALQQLNKLSTKSPVPISDNSNNTNNSCQINQNQLNYNEQQISDWFEDIPHDIFPQIVRHNEFLASECSKSAAAKYMAKSKCIRRERNTIANASNKRGKYKCSFCGQMKSNHICIVVSTKDVGTQVIPSKISIKSGIKVLQVRERLIPAKLENV